MTTLRLSYEQLGQRIGRSAEAARALARRQRWRVEKGNNGRAWVLVNEAELNNWQAPGERVVTGGHDPVTAGADRSASGGGDETTAIAAVKQAEALLAARERAAAAEGENRVLRERVDDLKAQLAQEREQAQQGIDEMKMQVSRERARRHEVEALARRPWWRKLLR